MPRRCNPDAKHFGPMAGPGCKHNTAACVPPTYAAVPAALADLETFLHALDQLQVLVKIVVAHVKFETIPPFPDGNGRVGRLANCVSPDRARPTAQTRAALVTLLDAAPAGIPRAAAGHSRPGRPRSGSYGLPLRRVRRGHEMAKMARRVPHLREARRTAITAQLGRAPAPAQREI